MMSPSYLVHDWDVSVAFSKIEFTSIFFHFDGELSERSHIIVSVPIGIADPVTGQAHFT